MGNIVSILRQTARTMRSKLAESGISERGHLMGGSKTMSQVSGAFLRAFLVAVLVAMPALFLPSVAADTAQAVTLIALFAAGVTFAEYSAVYPGLIQFRDAPPYNRIRFISLFFMVLFMSVLVRADIMPNNFGMLINAVSIKLGLFFDFPYSPVRLLVLSLPEGLRIEHLVDVMSAGALAYVIGLLSLVGFMVAILVGYWPQRHVSFNVWVNLPTFDPTAGVDIVQRLEREALVNISLGILMPFLLPVLLRMSMLLIQPITLESPLAFVWGISLWAFLPVNLVMRGVAMTRVARMISDKRRQIAAEDDLIPRPARSVYS
jgi:hypothetical protein